MMLKLIKIIHHDTNSEALLIDVDSEDDKAWLIERQNKEIKESTMKTNQENVIHFIDK